MYLHIPVTLKKKLRENINNKPDVTNKLMSQLKCHQEIYRENILELYNLKKEAAHLSHGFQQAKRRVMRRFREWWENYKKSNNSYEQSESSSSTMFSPKSPTDYFNWDPEISSCNLDQPALQSVCNVDSFPSVFDSECMDQFSDFKFDSSDLKQFKERNFPEQSLRDLPMQFLNPNFNGQGDRENFHLPQIPKYPQMQRHDNNYVCDQMKNPRPAMHRIDCDPNQLMMPNPMCNMNQQYYRQQPSQNQQQFMNPMRTSYNCYEIDPKGQPFPGAGFNQFPEAYQQNFMNYDLPEKLPNNYQKQAGFYGYAPPPPGAYIAKPPNPNSNPNLNQNQNPIVPDLMYHPNFANGPQMARDPYEDRRPAQYVDIVIKPGVSNNYYPHMKTEPNSRDSVRTVTQWNEEVRNIQSPNETEVHASSLPNSPRNIQETNFAVANYQLPNITRNVSNPQFPINNPQNVVSSQSYTYVSPEIKNSNSNANANANANLNKAEVKEPSSQQIQAQNPSEEEGMENIPLTGDPEVDEEILSFYRSKNILQKQINQ